MLVLHVTQNDTLPFEEARRGVSIHVEVPMSSDVGREDVIRTYILSESLDKLVLTSQLFGLSERVLSILDEDVDGTFHVNIGGLRNDVIDVRNLGRLKEAGLASMGGTVVHRRFDFRVKISAFGTWCMYSGRCCHEV
jgi:hypothetical protein